MGKRSALARRERDFYPTPAAAVRPLLPHLPPRCRFIEPCAGDGALVHCLTLAGHECVAAFDVEPRDHGVSPGDALSAPLPARGDTIIITNPPWSRSVLHPMIERFSDTAPTWLLFDADWVHTRQAVPYLPRLRKIVSVGRVKWIAGSPHTGKDNCAWHLFSWPGSGPAVFVGRAA